MFVLNGKPSEQRWRLMECSQKVDELRAMSLRAIKYVSFYAQVTRSSMSYIPANHET